MTGIKHFVDWEQRKLGELATFSKGRGYSKSDLEDKGNPIILYGRLYTNYETVIEEVNTYVEKKENSTVSRGNEVIVPASGETSEDISRASVIAKSGIIIGGDLNIINTKEDIAPTFLALTISNGTQQKELTRRAQGKSVVHIRNSDLKTVELRYPEKDEQLRIGTFFKHLNRTIALHQEKLSKLYALKEAYLQEMFTQDKESNPKVRFTNFSENWEKRKLSEVLNVNSGRDYKHLKSGDVPVYGTGGYMLSVDQCLSDEDAIGIGRKGTINKPQYLKSPFWTVDTLFYMTANRGYDLLFVYSISQTVRWKKYDESTGVPSLSKTTINNIIKSFPSHKEQVAIGKFFDKINKLINLEKIKMDKLKNLKKAYLRKMFI